LNQYTSLGEFWGDGLIKSLVKKLSLKEDMKVRILEKLLGSIGTRFVYLRRMEGWG